MRACAVSLLILTLPVLASHPPDPATIQGHLATCPHCVRPGE